MIPIHRRQRLFQPTVIALTALAACLFVSTAQAEEPAAAKKPNIVVIMGDDIGWFNIGAYHQGMMAGRTPNLDKLATEGMRFTDYYAEASCTAGPTHQTSQDPTRPKGLPR